MHDLIAGFQQNLISQSVFWNPDLNAPCRTWRLQFPKLIISGSFSFLRYPFKSLWNLCFTEGPSIDKWMILEWFMGSVVCKMLQMIICCGVTHQKRVPMLHLNSINVQIMSVWQVWVIWFMFLSKPTDRDLDLLTSRPIYLWNMELNPNWPNIWSYQRPFDSGLRYYCLETRFLLFHSCHSASCMSNHK